MCGKIIITEVPQRTLALLVIVGCQACHFMKLEKKLTRHRDCFKHSYP